MLILYIIKLTNKSCLQYSTDHHCILRKSFAHCFITVVVVVELPQASEDDPQKR